MRIEMLLVLAACQRSEPENRVFDASATILDTAPTIVRVTWHTELPVRGWVSFGPDGEPVRETPHEAEPSTDHEAHLIGLPENALITWQIAGEDGIGSESMTLTTGDLPDELPTWTLSGAPDDRFRAMPLLSGTTDEVWIVVVDPQGRVVWAHKDVRGAAVFRARVLRDGSGIVYSSTLLAGEPSDMSAIVRVSWDGTEDEVAVPWLAHDFVELPDGTIASLAYVTVNDVQGNEIVLLSPSGEQTIAWSTFDCFDPINNPGDDPEHGWTHANALDYDQTRDLFIVGMRNLGTIVEVDRVGNCGDAFGGTGGNVALEGATFYHQHQFERIDGKLIVFDNDGAPGNESRVIEYDYIEGSGTASLSRIIRADPAVYSFILGDLYRSETGDTTITWSVAGLIDRYSPSGERLMRIEADTQTVFGFTHTFSSPYNPE